LGALIGGKKKKTEGTISSVTAGEKKVTEQLGHKKKKNQTKEVFT